MVPFSRQSSRRRMIRVARALLVSVALLTATAVVLPVGVLGADSGGTGATGATGPTGGDPMPILEIDKTGPGGAFPGQVIVFTITVRNTGTAPARRVNVIDTLPPNCTFIDSDPAGKVAGGKLTVELGEIAAGASKTLTVRCRAPNREGVLVTNTALADIPGGSGAGPATATVSIGMTTNVKGGAVAAAGTSLRNRREGTITIAGLPAGAQVRRAVLTWVVLANGAAAPANTITFQKTPVTASYTSRPSGRLCWTAKDRTIDTGTFGYAADVTGLIAPGGNGAYVVKDPPGVPRNDTDPTPDSFPATDGAGLFVFYKAPGVDNQVIANFTYQSNDRVAVQRFLSGIQSQGKNSTLILAGADGQSDLPDRTSAQNPGGQKVLTNAWAGTAPQPGKQFPNGSLWDTLETDVSALLPQGRTNLNVTLSAADVVGKDCVGLSATLLSVEQ
jgi:uncharacterized repeat protein (TIGR01451 family)